MRRWRESLASSRALRAEDLDELESHLRDSISSLEAVGLSAREAFWVGTSRIGPADRLDQEFAKVSVERLWMDRALWMVVGSLGILVASSLVSLFANLITVVVQMVTGWRAVVGPLSLAVYVAALGALLLVLWRSGTKWNGVAWRAAAWMKQHPIATATGVALFFAFNAVSSMLTSSLATRVMPLSTYGMVLMWRWSSVLLPVFFWPVVLAWLLKRTAESKA